MLASCGLTSGLKWKYCHRYCCRSGWLIALYLSHGKHKYKTRELEQYIAAQRPSWASTPCPHLAACMALVLRGYALPLCSAAQTPLLRCLPVHHTARDGLTGSPATAAQGGAARLVEGLQTRNIGEEKPIQRSLAVSVGSIVCSLV